MTTLVINRHEATRRSRSSEFKDYKFFVAGIKFKVCAVCAYCLFVAARSKKGFSLRQTV